MPESVEVYTPIDDKERAVALILVHATANPAPLSGALRSAATLPGAAPQVFTFQSQSSTGNWTRCGRWS